MRDSDGETITMRTKEATQMNESLRNSESYSLTPADLRKFGKKKHLQKLRGQN